MSQVVSDIGLASACDKPMQLVAALARAETA
jgi:hypothetical protein